MFHFEGVVRRDGERSWVVWCHPEGRVEGWKSGRGNAEKGHRRQMFNTKRLRRKERRTDGREKRD